MPVVRYRKAMRRWLFIVLLTVCAPPVIDPKMAVDPEAQTEEERHPTVPSEQTEPPKT